MQAGFQPVERLIRLAPRSIKDNAIPWHPAFADIAPKAHSRPAFDQFLKVAIRQGVHFSSRILPGDVGEQGASKDQSVGWKFKEVKKIDGNDVRIHHRKLRPDQFHVPVTGTNSSASDALSSSPDDKEVTEYWFARESIHTNAAEDGTASYEEFFSGLKENHSENEKEFTPGIKWANKLLEWEGAPDVGFRGETWTDLHMSIYEICHGLPPGIKDRVFPILLIHAKISPTEFTVISLPLIDTDLLPGSKIPTHSNPNAGANAVIVGKYVAVERVRVLRAKEEEPQDAKSKVEWLMCTSSDAGGWLPMVMQRGKIPGEIAKDVGLFLGWAGNRRKEERGEGGEGTGEE